MRARLYRAGVGGGGPDRRLAGAGRRRSVSLVVSLDGRRHDRRLDRRHARAQVRIKEVVPGFDGRRLDDIVDFLNYTFLPLLLIWRAGILPAGQEAWLFLPLLASVYGFCQVQAKTEDGYFLGFPSLWNLVALYLYVLPLPRLRCRWRS